MKRANLVLALSALVCLAGCEDKGIGLKCINPTNTPPMPNVTQLSSPALECHTRICEITADGNATNNNSARTVCTDLCQTDDDCKNAVVAADDSGGQCATSFRCAIATVSGDYKCKSICICKDDLVCGVNVDVDGNVIIPKACPGGIDPPPGC